MTGPREHAHMLPAEGVVDRLPVTPREEWERLAEARAHALAAEVEDYTRQGLTAEQAAKEANDDAALLLTSALRFADDVDRSGRGIPYAEAVVIEGSAGPVVCTAEEYRDNRVYWEAVAAGGHGRIDRSEVGALLLHYLQTGENVEDVPGLHRMP